MSNAPTLLSDVEKAEIRYHGGYLNTDPVLSMQLGTPALSQESFVVDGAMNRIRPEAVGIVRRLLAACHASEQNLLSAQRRLRATAVGSITLNNRECDQVRREYSDWVTRLYETLGAPRNPYSTRFRDGPPPLSIPVFPT